MKISKLLNTNKLLIHTHFVNGLKTNSKKVKANDIFYAISGSNFDGNDYIIDAIKKGAKTIISEKSF